MSLKRSFTVPGATGGNVLENGQPYRWENEQHFDRVTVSVMLGTNYHKSKWAHETKDFRVTAIETVGDVHSFLVYGHRTLLAALVSKRWILSVQWVKAGLPAFGRVPMDEFGQRTDRAPAVPHDVRTKLQTQQRQAATVAVAALERKWAAE